MNRRGMANRLRAIHNNVGLDASTMGPQPTEIIASGASALWEVIEEVEGEAAAAEREWAREELRTLAASIDDPIVLRKWAATAIHRADEMIEKGLDGEAIEDAKIGADLLQIAVLRRNGGR